MRSRSGHGRGEVPGDGAAPVVADEIERLRADGVGKGQDVGAELLDAVAAHVGQAAPGE